MMKKYIPTKKEKLINEIMFLLTEGIWAGKEDPMACEMVVDILNEWLVRHSIKELEELKNQDWLYKK